MLQIVSTTSSRGDALAAGAEAVDVATLVVAVFVLSVAAGAFGTSADKDVLFEARP
jgi:hypothetical protein